MRVVLPLAIAVSAFLPWSSPSAAAPAVACPAAIVHYERDASGDPRLAGLPWVKTKPEAVGLRGRLFYYTSAGPAPPPCVRQRNRKFEDLHGRCRPGRRPHT